MGSPWYRFIRITAYLAFRILTGLRIEGLDKVPRSGALIVTSNHISNLDPPLLGSVIPRELGFAAKKELFDVPVLGALIRSLNSIPVDRAQLSIGALRTFGEFLETGRALIFFPEGTRGKPGRFRKPKVGVGMVLDRHPVTIVPAYIEGTDSLIRSMLRRGRMRVVFGDPYALPREEGGPEDRRDRYRRYAEAVMDRIRELQESLRTDDREPGLPARETAPPGAGPSPAGPAPNTKEGKVPEE